MRMSANVDEPLAPSVYPEAVAEEGPSLEALPDYINPVTTTGEKIQGVQYVEDVFELTPEIREHLKTIYGKRAKKITLMNQDYVFLVMSRGYWENTIDEWKSEFIRNNKKEPTPEQEDRNLIETAVLFPACVTPERFIAEFNNVAERTTYYNNLPAGVQPRLARYIEHYAGYFIEELLQENDLFAEDISDAPGEGVEPTEEDIAQIKAMTKMPIRKVRIFETLFFLRAMTWQELKSTQAKIKENPLSDADTKQIAKCLLAGPTNFEDMPAGVVPLLLAHLQEISGLGQTDVFNTAAEDL